MNLYSLPNCVFYSEFVIRCWNWIVCSEFAFTAELCVLQRICDSLLKLSYLQRIRVRCQSCIFYSEIVTRCRNWVVYSELTFIAENVWLQQSSINCRNYGTNSETVFAAELCSLQRTSFCCWIVWPTTNQFLPLIFTIGLLGRNDSNACNNFIVWWCKIWNTWMWTYELLKQIWWWMLFKDTNLLICDHWCLRWCGEDRTIIRTRTTRKWSR